ncbi:hypothetical protein FAZ95_30695 [Trinickia violacea]|uniref:Uncharacterized protein n=1 Tax=Trinickia violacea TaxID=2571746 RepID=A0A4P8IY03_9BURK|nr:hypothetical protein FAZ95_30695 [Trinickia violacea]
MVFVREWGDRLDIVLGILHTQRGILCFVYLRLRVAIGQSNPISRTDAALALLDRIDRGLADRGILISCSAAPPLRRSAAPPLRRSAAPPLRQIALPHDEQVPVVQRTTYPRSCMQSPYARQ